MPEPETGLNEAEVMAAVQAAPSKMPEPGISATQVEAATQQVVATMPEPGVTQSEVQALIGVAVADLPEVNTGLTAEEARRPAPYTATTFLPKTSPSEYTKFCVSNTMRRYETEGSGATLPYYNWTDSIDGQWYVLVVDEEGEVISRLNAHVLGENLDGPLETDAERYDFWSEMLAATAEGKWVAHGYNDPGNGNVGGAHLVYVELEHG